MHFTSLATSVITLASFVVGPSIAAPSSLASRTFGFQTINELSSREVPSEFLTKRLMPHTRPVIIRPTTNLASSTSSTGRGGDAISGSTGDVSSGNVVNTPGADGTIDNTGTNSNNVPPGGTSQSGNAAGGNGPLGGGNAYSGSTGNANGGSINNNGGNINNGPGSNVAGNGGRSTSGNAVGGSATGPTQ